MTPAEQGQERYISECPECGRVADQDDEGMWCCVGGHCWTQPLAEPIKLVPADHKRVLEQELARAREERDAFDATWQAATKRREAAEKSVRVLVEALKWIRATAGGGRGSNTPPLVEIERKASAALETVSGDVQEGERCERCGKPGQRYTQCKEPSCGGLVRQYPLPVSPGSEGGER